MDRERHKRRNIVERRFNQLKRLRGITTRYDKPAIHYRAAVTIARLVLRLNHDPPNTPYAVVFTPGKPNSLKACPQ
ncbi:hypothetical protein FDA94_30770 [Herbidospora galbida]|uniref:Uncharacterized protein n=1 Tax=Herbidospora galbida TaxID=2575442 RepID=A0A4U3M9G7_9ACTN|nr:hypothetical protein FDA94_30770 [Herbidospora galbida]